MTPGAHRMGRATRPAAELLADLAVERQSPGILRRRNSRAAEVVGHQLAGPISDKLRELEAAGVVGAKIIYHEDDDYIPPFRIAAPARSPWFRRFRRGQA